MFPKHKVYLAAPLFSLPERALNRCLAEAIEAARPDVEVLLPQNFKYHGKFNDPRTFGTIFQQCVEGVQGSAAVVAILDGPDADSGTCFEVGFAYAKGIPVIGVRTDYRASQEKGVNIMLSRCCAKFIWRPGFSEDLAPLFRDVAAALERVLPPRRDAPQAGL